MEKQKGNWKYNFFENWKKKSEIADNNSVFILGERGFSFPNI